MIDEGWSVCIWNDRRVSQYKDINDMIQGGLTQDEIVEVITSNSYTGLSAKTKLTEWKRI